MGYLKKLALFISVIILGIFIIGCDSSSDTAEKAKEDSKEEQIKKSFAKTLDMYPIKNLEDLYDKEGYRDGEFKKAMGNWTLLTSFSKSNKPGEIDDEGMVLYLNRNTKKATGYYFVRNKIYDDISKNQNELRVELKNNKIIWIM